MSKINQISVDGVVYDIATKKEVELEAKINNKADKATTLDGYGITDAYTKDSVDGMLSQKNDILTFDTTPTADSTNPVTSGGVKVELDKKADKQNAATPEELERLNYYGNKDIVQSDESWFTVNAAGNTITGLTDTGKAQSGTLVIPYKINGKIITSLCADMPESIFVDALDKFTKVILPNSITSIAHHAFYYCTSLVSIEIPNGITGINAAVFQGCTSLKSISLSNSVTYIDIRAFSNCTSLNKIEIPASVRYIEENSFDEITPANLTVYCEQGSYAETYAKQKGFNVVYTDVSKTAFDSKADKTDIDALNTDIDTLKKLSVPHTTSSGYPVSVSDHLEGESVIDYKVYGNSVQDGTPTPDTPIEIQSVGDLVTDTSSPYYGKYDVPVTVCEKNLIPYPYSNTTETIKGITFTDNGDGTITANGTVTSTVQYSQFELKNKSDAFLLQGGTYTLSGVNGGSTTTFYIQLKNSDTDATIAIATNGGVTFNLNEPCYARGNLIIKSGTTVNNIVFKPQLELGTTATPYEPYQAPITKHIYLDEPLRKVGDYADYVDWGNQVVVRNILKFTLNGDLRGGKTTNSTDEYSGWFIENYAFSNMGTKQRSYLLCNMLPFNAKINLNLYMSIGFGGNSNLLYICLPTSMATTLSEASTILNGAICYMPLATPTTEPITAPDFDVPISEVMNVSSGTVIPPSSMDVTYYQDINKVITELKNAILAQGGNV